VSLDEIISSAIHKFRSKYPNRNIQVEIDDTTKILADTPRLSEAIYNLLTNAQEALNEEETGDNWAIFIKSYKTRQYVVIEIQDKGVGIPKKNLKKIIEPFYSTKNSNVNWGMGLFYVRAIMKEHLGNIRYDSSVGEGTTFYLYLPKLK